MAGTGFVYDKDYSSEEWGYLREHTKNIEKDKIKHHPINRIHKTGLDKYLEVIFPNRKWEHDKKVDGVDGRNRPDYRCESLRLIVEFNGLDHYIKPDIILRDEEKEKLFANHDYKVIQIPYFIQLTNKAVKTLFDVDVKESLFNENIPSLYAEDRCTPAFLCPEGIKRMAKDFLKFPEQYEINVKNMRYELENPVEKNKKPKDQRVVGLDLLEKEYNKLLLEKFKRKGYFGNVNEDYKEDYKNLVINILKICNRYKDILDIIMTSSNINEAWKYRDDVKQCYTFIDATIKALVNYKSIEVKLDDEISINLKSIKLYSEFIKNIINSNDFTVENMRNQAERLGLIK